MREFFKILSLFIIASVLLVCFPKDSFAGENEDSRSELIKRYHELKSKLFDEFTKDDTNADNMMDDFFSNSNKLMKDIDQNLFKSFGWGADLSSNLFKSRWRDEKDGRTFLITPQKNAEINIKVEQGMIQIDGTEKTKNGTTTSRVSLSVDDELDWNRASKPSQKGNDIEIFFPFNKAVQKHLKVNKSNSEAIIPLNKLKKLENDEGEEEEMIPIVPRDNQDVI